ncbi:MAG: hypothetical protein KC416_08350 [Myxococcales bacterium]|nr:hypothetical protein [Myxococcales bacterium]
MIERGPTTRWVWLGGLAFVVVLACLVGIVASIFLKGRNLGLVAFPVSIACSLVGIAVADFVSGSVHFLADRFGHEEIPVLGPNVIAPFRVHHDDPLAMTRHGFAETNGDNAIIVLPYAALSVWVCLVIDGPWLVATFGAFSLAFVAAILGTNQIHKWAHAPGLAPRPVRALQRRGWLLSPRQHGRHHVGNHDRAYCITTGWLNPLLDGAGFFPKFERLAKPLRPPGWRGQNAPPC